MKAASFFLFSVVASSTTASQPVATPVMPGIASTANADEVRITFSPDGKRALWGRIDKDAVRGFEIYESVNTKAGWSQPRPVSFNSPKNDFDPFFARDGRSVLFFSNRPGGMGGDDIWTVPVNPRTGEYGTPVNLGAPVNTPGDEWAPGLSDDGRQLLFSSNGHGGFGGQDLFFSARKGRSWGEPRNLGAGVNGSSDDFDAALVDGDTLIFTSGDAEKGPIALFRASWAGTGFSGRERLAAPFNCSPTFNLGPAWNPREPQRLYYSANCAVDNDRTVDIFYGMLPALIEPRR